MGNRSGETAHGGQLFTLNECFFSSLLISNILSLNDDSPDVTRCIDVRNVSDVQNPLFVLCADGVLKALAMTTQRGFELFANDAGSIAFIYQGRLVNSRVHVDRRDKTTRSVECFEGEIRQVLNNLVGNAIDALHPTGGRLLLQSADGFDWRTKRRGIVLTIADTGPGMPDLVRKKIFEAFYTTKGIGGTGLGLWVSKEIINRHQGTLSVRSSTSESTHGTIFRLFLPYDAVVR